MNMQAVAPTEAQIKLMIGQILSSSSAYNSPVIVLNFNPNQKDKIVGRFRDANRPRVFEFEITRKSISYKPFMTRTDTWEDFSQGYCYRLDVEKKVTGKKADCVKPTSYNCGSICINIKKSCRANVDDEFSKERIEKLFKLKQSYLDQASIKGTSQEDRQKFIKKNNEIDQILEPYTQQQKEQKQQEERVKQRKELAIEAKVKRQQLLKQSVKMYEELINNPDLSPPVISKAFAFLQLGYPEKLVNYEEQKIRETIAKLSQTNPEEAKQYTESLLNNIQGTKNAIDSILQQSRKLIEVDRPTPLDASYETFNNGSSTAYKEGVNAFSRLIDVPDINASINIVESDTKERSYYNKHKKSLIMGTTDSGTVVHELGHWLEHSVKGVREEVQEFYDKRTEGEKIVKLKDIVKNSNYEDNEVTKVDKWIDPYMGKVYPNSSEVLSMGIELMYRNPVYLAKKDPEMFDFIYSVVRRGNDGLSSQD